MPEQAPTLRAAIIPVTAFQQNCSILFDEVSKRAVVVDPGGDVDRILAAINEFDVDGSCLCMIVIKLSMISHYTTLRRVISYLFP